jgi:hypothetical protein
VSEIRLTGGFASEVMRIGETVRRTLSPNAGFVHELLDLFAHLDLGPGITKTADAVHGLRLLCDAAGVPGAITLQAAGVIEEAQAAWAWVAQHRPELEKGIRSDQQDRDGRTPS